MSALSDKNDQCAISIDENNVSVTNFGRFQEQNQGSVMAEEEFKATRDPMKVHSFEEFSGYTTLHGLRFIGDHTSTLQRRIFWILLVLLCGTLFGLQAHDRVQHFLASPTNVNVKIDYPDKIAFPAVTICNQNNFRISKAYEGNWLELIQYFYDKDQPLPSNRHLNTSLTELFEGLAHRKEDFIVRCQWANEDCSADNFTITRTSHGVCFTFNKVECQVDALAVYASGVEHALRLTLNTENYERLKGSYDTTGVKMLMTDQNEVPRVKEIGLAISTGTHAYIELSPLTLSNLPSPYGDCGEVPLVLTDRYNKYTCMLECETRYAYSKCGCRHFYMPELTGEWPVCSVEQYLTCLQKVLDYFNDMSQSLCTCPVSCDYNIYRPALSYAASSNLKTDIEDATNVTIIEKRYFAAKEISSKTDANLRREFNETLTSAILHFDIMNNMTETLKESMDIFSFGLQEINDEIKSFVDKVFVVLRMQMFILEKNMMAARDEMEKHTFRYVCQDYSCFIRDVHDKVYLIFSNNQRASPFAEVLYMLLNSSLSSTEDTMKRALDNYKQLVDAYKNGYMLLNNTDHPYNWRDLVAAFPTNLLNRMFFLGLNEQDIINLLEPIKRIGEYVIYLFKNNVTKVDDNRIKTFKSNFQDACYTFLVQKTIFYHDVIEYPVRTLKSHAGRIANMMNNINGYLSDHTLIDQINRKQSHLQYELMRIFDVLLAAHQYISGLLPNVAKYDIAQNRTILKFNDIVGTVDAIYFATTDLYLSWKSIIEEIESLHMTILQNADIREYFKHKTLIIEHVFNKLYNLTDDVDAVCKNLNKTAWDMKQNLTKAFGNRLLDLFTELDTHRMDYEMNENFYRRNFLQVDVFFRELRTEQITQQRGYGEIALLCDIGGATGLFIGGSVITVFEIAEFLLMCLVCRVCCRRAKRFQLRAQP